jgi:hypothetical protein
VRRAGYIEADRGGSHVPAAKGGTLGKKLVRAGAGPASASAEEAA